MRLGTRQALGTPASSDPDRRRDLREKVIDERALADAGLTGDGNELTEPAIRRFECDSKVGAFTNRGPRWSAGRET